MYQGIAPVNDTEPNDGDIMFYQAADRTIRWGSASGIGGDFDPLTETLYVDAGYSGGDSTGSIAKPFVTIQEAQDALTGSGILLIVAGIYDEVVNGTVPTAYIGINTDARLAGPVVTITQINNTEFCHFENCFLSEGAATVGLSALNCVFSGDPGIESPGNNVTLIDCQTDAIEAPLRVIYAQNCAIGGSVECLEIYIQGNNVNGSPLNAFWGLSNGGEFNRITAVGCTIAGECIQSGATGGGAAHANNPWRFIGCNFTNTCQLNSQGGGESLDIFLDKTSWQSVYANGVTSTGGRYIQDSAIGAFQAYATDDTNTVDTSTNALYKAAATAAFSNNEFGSAPWTLTAASCVIDYEPVYPGVGAPNSPPSWWVITLNVTARSVIGGTIGAAVDYNGDVIGQGLTDRSHGNGVIIAPANTDVNITATRLVEIADPTAILNQLTPAFASSSGDDLAIRSMTIMIAPHEFPAGW